MNQHFQPLPIPENIETEQELLGVVMRDSTGAVFDKVSALVDAEDFYEPFHKQLWSIIAELVKQGRPISIVTLRGAFDPGTEIGELSLNEYLVRLVAEYGQPFNATDYAGAIRALAIRRHWISAADEIRDISFSASPVAKIEDLIHQFEAALATARGRHKEAEDEDPGQQAIEQISRAYQHQGSGGISWFIREAEQVLGDDLEYGWLIGLLADSGGGKTSFALQQASHSTMNGIPVLFLSGDQAPSEVYRQIASQRASVQSSDLRKGRATPEEIERSIAVINDLKKRPFVVRKMGRPTTAEISMRVRAFNRQYGKGLVIIDHAKRISFTDRRSMLAEGVNQVYGDLKALMQETENVGLLLMQRNSDGGGRDNPKPVRSDAYGGAGALENLDGLLALYIESQWTSHRLSMARTDRLKEEIRDRAAKMIGKAELIGLKARFGAGGIVQEIKREAQFTRFASLTEDWRGGQPEMDL